MRYHTNTRKYIYVSTGKIVVKMAPFKNVKKLDFDSRLLTSPMNCWAPQPRFVSYINKIRFLEFDVTKGNMLYVPPYWIWSVQYAEDNTCLLEYNYQTVMNILAHPDGVLRSVKETIQSIFGNEKGMDTEKKRDIKQEENSDSETGAGSETTVDDNVPYDLSAIVNT